MLASGNTHHSSATALNRLFGIFFLLLATVSTSVAATSSVPYQEGNFDPTFGNGGRLLVPVSTLAKYDSAVRMVLRPGNRILLGGTCEYLQRSPDVYDPTFCVTQLNGDASYDSNFGPGGVGYLQFTRFAGWPTATDLVDMIVLRDGRIALLGYPQSTSASTQILLAVLLTDGSGLDSSVGGGAGFLQFKIGGADSQPNSLVQQPDGKVIVAGGATGVNGNEDFAATRLLADLSGIDTSFGSGGAQFVVFDLGGPAGLNTDIAAAVRLQSDGKIVMAGIAATSPAGQPVSGADIAIARLNSDGSRDLSFGTAGDGRIHYTAGLDVAGAFDAQIDAADRIVIGGVGANASGVLYDQYVIDRLSRNGGRDPTFNQGNPQTFVEPPYGGNVKHIALTNDGIFAIGNTARTPAQDASYFGVVRLNLDGSLDSRFGNAGRSYGSFDATSDANSTGDDIAVGDGGVMILGTQFQANPNGNTFNFALGRLQYDRIFSDGFE
jgi:uncharacterized delta-60 repeat protein